MNTRQAVKGFLLTLDRGWCCAQVPSGHITAFGGENVAMEGGGIDRDGRGWRAAGSAGDGSAAGLLQVVADLRLALGADRRCALERHAREEAAEDHASAARRASACIA